MFSHFSSPSRRLSCGVLVLNPEHELLLCHVTGQNHWDLPKGGIDDGETPLQAALRETREETGLRLEARALTDLGRFAYTGKKDLHLFATLMPRFDLSALHCESRFRDRVSGKHLPEMDGYRWAALGRVASMCTPKMGMLLAQTIDLRKLLVTLTASAATPRAAALAS